ncbi:MAG: hypothetical protein WEF50_11175 [Myxococcota bacterium]
MTEPDSFPATIPVAVLEQRHPTYDAELERDLEQLAGNEKFQAERFLRPRAVESPAVYLERRQRAYNVPRLGHLVETLCAAVFEREPRVQVEGAAEGDPAWAGLLGTADGGTATLNSALRLTLKRAVLHGDGAVWVDFPRRPADAPPGSMTVAAADARGLRVPLLHTLAPGEIRDFDVDEKGSLRWATIGYAETRRPLPISAATEQVSRWAILTRDTWATYQHTKKDNQTAGRGAEATLEASGAHAFGRVPVARLVLPSQLALGPLLHSLAKQLVELDNAISWQQFMSLFAMPVVKTSSTFSQVMGESNFIKLEPGDDFSWAEPQGTALELSLRHRDVLREEFYRVAHGHVLGFGSDATTAGRSGESKRQDWRATQHALSHLGALVREFTLDIISLVAAGRGETVRASVTGLDSFDLEATSQRLEEHALADSMIRSPRWRVERGRSLVRRLAPELSDDALEAIDAELAEDDFEPPKFEKDEA